MAEVLHLSELRPAFTLSEQYPRMLTFEQPNGDPVSLPWGDLRSVRYTPESLIVLRFTYDKVDIHGRNLLPVWRALRSRRVSRLRAETESGGLVRPAFEPHISSIVFTETVRPA